MRPWLEEKFANPHSPHRLGREAAAAVEVAREQVLAALGGRRQALFHLGRDRGRQLGAERRSAPRRPDRHAGDRACLRARHRRMARPGRAARSISCRSARTASSTSISSRRGSTEGTGLVAAMLVNNEIGVIQPVAEIAAHRPREGRALLLRRGPGLRPRAAAARRLRHGRPLRAQDPRPEGHRRPLGARRRRARALASTAAGRKAACAPGTLSPRSAPASARPRRCCRRTDADAAHVERLWAMRIASRLAGWTLNGSPTQRYHGNLNLRRDGVDAARLISEVREVAFSAGSACASGSGRPSHVLARARPLRARGALQHPPRLRPLHDRGRSCAPRSA